MGWIKTQNRPHPGDGKNVRGCREIKCKGSVFLLSGTGIGRPKLHFWRYADLKDESILDNRYLVANLIAERDTPRVVDPEIFGSIFDLQERVVEDIRMGRISWERWELHRLKSTVGLSIR